jgi:hypothetical protein
MFATYLRTPTELHEYLCLQPIRLFIGSCVHLHSDCGSHIIRRLLLLLMRV